MTSTQERLGDRRRGPVGARLDSIRRWSSRAPWVGFLGRRIAQGLVVVFGAVLISFVLVQLSGDPAEVLARGLLPDAQVRQLSHQLGYDRPFLVQFLDYFGRLLHGDLGQSFRYHQSAASLVLQALPNTGVLVVGAMVLASIVALAASTFSTLHRETPLDQLIRRVLIVAQGLPEYWLGLMLLMVFGAWARWLPVVGFSSWSAAILPVVTLAAPIAGVFTRLLRSQLLDQMQSDFVVALRAKGLTEREIVVRHALPNAMIPFVTYLALQLGWLVGGTIVVEAVFTWPGIGSLALAAVKTRDLQVIQAVVVVVAVVYVACSLAADLIVAAIDPRIRTGRSA
jgi:ABC-type dipeptide/oligopeptide/nickel transport system permease component